MIVYNANKARFLEDVRANEIHTKIQAEFQRKLFRKVAKSELDSWRNSMQFLSSVLADESIPADAGVAIEYTIPLTSKRIDFILSGRNGERQEIAVIIELKQWSEVKVTQKDAVVKTWLGGAEVETSHPAYQAWTYAVLIEDYNETVRRESIRLMPCAYLHNLDTGDAINDPVYAGHIAKAPVFISKDAKKLADFLKQHVRYGDADDILYRIEHGRIKPSKNLADTLVSMLEGNNEFLMIDDQKIAYETAIDLVHHSQKQGKQVLIVEGGPGTGKSVVAINLLVELTHRELTAQYVTKNAAPRAVYAARLSGSMTLGRINNLFRGSGVFVDTDKNTFDALVVDEGHRLNAKSGMMSNKGENQVKEIINAGRCAIFFLDESQRIHWKDIGSRKEVEKWANELGAEITTLALESQFRCNGSDGYLAWLDNSLQIRNTANTILSTDDYDFRVFDDPNKLRAVIIEKNRINNKSRLVAGYCWEWASKKNPDAMDIVLPEHDFSAQWNLDKDGSLWIISPDSVNEIGCIHTCQGLELDYVGVIVGPDFIVRDGKVITDAVKRSHMDSSIRGFKKLLREDKESALERADEIIKNTYRTLMSRGQKGCFIYCVDPETNAWFRSLLSDEVEDQPAVPEERYPGLSLPVLDPEDVRPFINAVPLYDLQAAAGGFSDYQMANEFDWVSLPDDSWVREGLFVARVVGKSMNRRIPSGAWCLFKANPGGTRQGKVVLVEHRDIQDPDHGGTYSVKVYESVKTAGDEGEWRHSRIILKPDSDEPGYQPIILDHVQEGELRVIGELVAVLG